jgi:mono/diheme cytochrome c family protein
MQVRAGFVRMGRLGWQCGAVRRAVAGVGAAVIVSFAAPAPAQAQATAGLEAWKKGGCQECHGTFAEGGGGGENPAGPSLRVTRLDREALKETIACGRPQTGMPYHLASAYTRVPCFGISGAVPAGTREGASLTVVEIDALVAYLSERIVGKGAITRQECGLYFGAPDHPLCRQYR